MKVTQKQKLDKATTILSELLKTPHLAAETDLKVVEAQELLLDIE
jgi:hypothetical protein